MDRKILITGGSGLIGKQLAKSLNAKGYDVVILGRKENLGAEIPVYCWNIDQSFIDGKALEGVTDIVHLAGAGIADKPWTKQRKQELIDSRVKSAALLIDQIKKNGNRLNSFIGASAVGYYGAVTTEKIFTESDPSSGDFLGTCCKYWEDAYLPITESGVRTCVIRVGVVLARDGGALNKLAGPVRKGLATALGSGKQIVPWIHIDDVVGIFMKALEDDKMDGCFNAVAPELVDNYQMTKSIAEKLSRPFFLPNVPTFVLKIILGEMSNIILEGSAVSADKIQSKGYQFKYTQLKTALDNLLGD